MQERHFYVEDANIRSSFRRQRSGISQGFTLSPLIFVTIMSVIMHDAVASLPAAARAAYDKGDLADLVYADDTLLIGTNSEHLHTFLTAVEAAGKSFGLELHSGKFQLLQIRTNEPVINTDGIPISAVSSLGYLGASLASDGRVGSELYRRIGIAKGDFSALRKVWNRTSLGLQRKVAIFKALIESKLLYGLSCACFTSAELRRLDGFQARCLRQVLNIQPAFVSRVSNEQVLRQADTRKASELLSKAQLGQLGKVLRSSSTSPLFKVSFFGHCWQPAVNRFVRRVGRPRKEWVPEVLANGIRLAGGLEELINLLSAEGAVWRHFLRAW